MSEPVKKPTGSMPGVQPESYDPHRPEIVSMVEQAQDRSIAEPALAEAIPVPEIIAKRFLLAGFEAAIDLKDAHWPGMDKVKAALKENLHKLGNLVQPLRFFDVWEADPNANYKKKKNHSRRCFFFGVEVLNLEGIPEGFVTKDFPETTYALFKEREHGSPKFNWLEEAGYKFDTKYAENYAMDIEIYGDMEDEGPEWDALIPIERPESYDPRTPEIVSMVEQAQDTTPQKKIPLKEHLSEITLVDLPKRMVASYEVISGSPEGESEAFIVAWIEKHGLRTASAAGRGDSGVIRYGFDCHKGRDICGENTACTRPALLAGEKKGCWKCRIYHQYVTLPEGAPITGDSDVAVKEFPGGRFARIAVRDPFTCDFPSAWYELLKWAFKHKIPNRLGCKSKKDCYSVFSNEESPCLEELYWEDGVQYMAMYLPVEPPESYDPRRPEIVGMVEQAQAASGELTKKLPKRYRVAEHGARKKGRHCPHDMAYPSMISALKTFMGMDSRVVRKGEWLDDLDYFFQMGITLEGFGLFYGVPLEYDGFNNQWGDQPLRNSLAAEGILYHIAAVDGAAIHDALLDAQALKAQVCAHLAGNRPLLITKRSDDCLLLVTGYREHGDVLIANPFSGGDHERNIAVRLKRNSKQYSDWMQGLRSVIYINGIGEPAGRAAIIRQTLEAAYEMLTDTQLACDMDDSNYYYGEALYTKWIARLENDDNYKDEKDRHKYLDPEWCDLAERRWYSAHFFMECGEYLGQGALAAAIQAFKDIHDHMWDIHRLGMDKNDGKLLERETRDEIIAIIKKCRELDLLAAENIKEALGGI